jgi:hypothetical protein
MYDWKARGAKEEDNSTSDSVDLWMAICHLRNGLKMWKQQLASMVAHVDELSETQFSDVKSDSKPDVSGANDSQSNDYQSNDSTDLDQLLRTAGVMIKERLTEIMAEYDDKVRHCDMIMEGMTMATQLVTPSSSSIIFPVSRFETKLTLQLLLPDIGPRKSEHGDCRRDQKRRKSDEIHCPPNNDIPTSHFCRGK